jgi:3-hydroxymyristoyl/3-hydroxydecanoyl-(acyl carrier protein) dehydratase/uncharacterized membrane protein
MNSTSKTALGWVLPALAVAYLIAANVAFTSGSPPIAAAAIAILVVGLLFCIRGKHRHALRVALGLAGALFVFAVAEGFSPPLPLLILPILVPATLAWAFARSLRPHRMPLIERFARAFHAPDGLPDGVAGYTRTVTIAWTALLAGSALANTWMAMHVFPGGLLHAAGIHTPWPVTPAAFGWLSNIGSYLLVGAMFVIEFVVRLIRFPAFEFRNPVEFLRRARTRMPGMLENFRGGDLPGTLRVPSNHPVLAGHFPGRPLVPGVMLLEWTLREAAHRLGRNTSQLRIRECKFVEPLLPGEEAELRFASDTRRCSFQILRGSAILATGIIEPS